MLNLTVLEIAKIIDGNIIGDSNIFIKQLNRIEDAKQGDITFLSRPEYEKHLTNSYVSCVIVPKDFNKLPAKEQAFIKVDNPYLSFIMLLKHYEATRLEVNEFRHPSAQISNTAIIGNNVQIHSNSVISDNCRIGDNSIIMPNVVLYNNVIIGTNTIVNSNVVCYQDIKIGNNCIIHSGAIIGADGFGYLENKETGEYEKIPQVGNVIIEDDVEIGANATIDRALLGSTLIERGVKIDNMVHIAHNCLIGENTGIAAQTGISGSSKIGKRNRFGGQVGLAGHLETADDVTLIAQSGVSKSVNKAGIYFGTPIKERLQAFKIEACLRQLPDLFADFERLKKELKSNNL